jgi:hypothetical protein
MYLLHSFQKSTVFYNLRRMRIPLTLAAFISPICLFMPKKLYDIEVACESILNIWHSLGNQKPTNIKNIKDEIWELLAKLVESKDIETDISYTLETISLMVNELKSIDEDIGTWFKNDQTVVANIPFGTLYIEDPVGDTEHRNDRITDDALQVGKN